MKHSTNPKQGRKREKKEKTGKTEYNSTTSTITLNVNDLHTPIKKVGSKYM